MSIASTSADDGTNGHGQAIANPTPGGIEDVGGLDLRGVDFTGGFEGLKRVEEVSRFIQGLWQVLLALCAFGVLTMLSFRDDQLLDHGGESMTQVPVLQAAISPAMFAIVVPVVVLVIYLYFLVYIFTLWKELSFLPAYFPDGMPLDRRAYPMLLSSYVRVHFDRLPDWWPARFQMWVGTIMAFGLPTLATFVFWVACLRTHHLATSLIQAFVFAAVSGLSVSFFLLARPVLRREPWESWSPIISGSRSESISPEVSTARGSSRNRAWRRLILLLILGLAASAGSYYLGWAIPYSLDSSFKEVATYAVRTIPWIWCAGWIFLVWKSCTPWRMNERTTPTSILLSWTCLLPFFASTTVATVQVFESGNSSIRGTIDYQPAGYVYFTALDQLGLNVFLDLTDKSLSTKPPNWTGKPDLEDQEITSVIGANLEGADLRSLDANRVFLIRANLRRANLEFANLRNANLRGADLREARLKGAVLRNASLRDAWLQAAYLSEALLKGFEPGEPIDEGKVDVQGARLEGVNCQPRELKNTLNYELAYYGVRSRNEEFLTDGEKAVNRRNKAFMRSLGLNDSTTDQKLALKEFSNFVFQSSDLRGADFRSFKLDNARFKDQSILRNARFNDADLRSVRMIDADLRGADFRRAKLDGLDLRGAALIGADFTGADMRQVLNLTQDQYSSTKVDKDTRLPLKFNLK